MQTSLSVPGLKIYRVTDWTDCQNAGSTCGFVFAVAERNRDVGPGKSVFSFGQGGNTWKKEFSQKIDACDLIQNRFI